MAKILLGLVSTVLLLSISNAEKRPNYITEEEFAIARANPIRANNRTVLPLPPSDEATVAHPRPGFGPRLWTNAEVPYTLDPTFSDAQRIFVAQALDAFHTQTCIRFIPKTNQGSWVDILHDPAVCGVAHVCMNSGAQFAKFGGSCVNPGTMVHELGHTLCMGHEQTRLDRDKWIGFNEAICTPHGKDNPDFNRGLHKLYDFVSIEHYEGECYNGCFVPKIPGVTKCGSGGPLGVLDVEVLNELYGCARGCLGYRYINSVNQLDRPLGVGTNFNGETLYSCRAYHNGDIVPGKYSLISRECHVAYSGGEHKKTEDVEVLTDPNNANFRWVQADRNPANAVAGGRSNERETLYVVRCYTTVGSQTEWLPGKFQPSIGRSYTSHAGAEMICGVGNVEFLVCG